MEEVIKLFKQFIDDESINPQYKWMLLALLVFYNKPDFSQHGGFDSAQNCRVNPVQNVFQEPVNPIPQEMDDDILKAITEQQLAALKEQNKQLKEQMLER